MEKLRTAIVGCGKVTDLHAAALIELENSDFKAVCSRSQLEKGGERHGGARCELETRNRWRRSVATRSEEEP